MCRSLIKALRAGIMWDDLILHKEAKKSREASYSGDPNNMSTHLGDGSGEVKYAAGESWKLPKPAIAQMTNSCGDSNSRVWCLTCCVITLFLWGTLSYSAPSHCVYVNFDLLTQMVGGELPDMLQGNKDLRVARAWEKILIY